MDRGSLTSHGKITSSVNLGGVFSKLSDIPVTAHLSRSDLCVMNTNIFSILFDRKSETNEDVEGESGEVNSV